MGKLAALWRGITRWYVSSLLFAAVGVALGYVIFFNVSPGKPQIGIIDIPFTTISDDSAFAIGEMLDFTSRTDSIKGVVIRLNSPGGGAAASEQLFLKTLSLRERKPVVVVAQDIVASGGYMWAMGSNYIYAKPTSFVGSVGAVFFLPKPDRPPEELMFTGPAKLTGGSQRTFVGMLEMVKEAFVNTVVSQRGSKLKITPQELSEARIYPGMEAVRLGIVDAIGSDTDAIEKAASLAGISHYELVDVNSEVLRLLVQKLRRIFESSETDELPLQVNDVEGLRKLLRSLATSRTTEEAFPGFPTESNLPRIYYLYVPPSE